MWGVKLAPYIAPLSLLSGVEVGSCYRSPSAREPEVAFSLLSDQG